VEPLTEPDALLYEQREAQSPEAGQFVGGHVGVFPVIVLFGIVLLLALLLFEKKP